MSVGTTGNTATLTFPRQYAATRRFTLGVPRNITVLDGPGHGVPTVLFLRSVQADDPTLGLWSLDVGNGDERLLVDPRALNDTDADLPAAERARRERARESASGIVGYSTDRSGTLVAFALAGLLYVYSRATGEIRQLPTEAGVFDPRLDPTGTRVAYVVGNGLFVQRVEGSAEMERVIKSADDRVSWGRADFIAAEEMGRSRGYWWSPEGTALLATKVDESRVSRWFIGNPADPKVAPTDIAYPAAGTTNAKVSLALVPVDSALDPVDIAWSEGGRFEYLASVLWAEDKPPLIIRQTRDQRLLSIAELDPTDGSLAEGQQIEDQTWVELIPGSPSWSEAGLLTVEDRSEHDRRMLCVDGTPISGDSIHVRAIVGVVSEPARAIVSAWTEPESIGVFSIDLASGELRPLKTGQGVHLATVGQSMMVTTSSVLDRPGSTWTISTLDDPGHDVAVINATSATPLITARPELVRLGDRRLPSVVLLPEGHDGQRQLPVLLDPYGGPHAQRVLAIHNNHLVSQWFANQGFAVIVTDGAGTPGLGPAFEREVWGDLAQPVLDDQIHALDAAAERYPFIDLGRVGIRGWSFGGYLAALAVLRRPDRFHAAIAGAPVTTWHLYDTHYTERYLGHPAHDPHHYERSDLLAEVDAAKGREQRPLLLIHGLADDNVVAAHTLQLSSALLAAGRKHSVLPLSGVTHMTPQEVVAENLLLLQRDFLADHLGTDTINREAGDNLD